MVTKRIFLGDIEETLLLCGEQDSHLKKLEQKFGVQIFARSSTLAVRGNPRKVDQTIASLEERRDQIRSQRMNHTRFPSYANESGGSAFLETEKPQAAEGSPENSLYKSATGKTIQALSPQQRKYAEAVRESDMVMAVGPAGTGKTFLAVAFALNALHASQVQRIILTRPVVEAGEKLGFLPGDLNEKVNPYLRPLFDAFHILLGPERFRIYREDGTIEIVPLAYMRGRTLEKCFVILDEAQNTTPQQMKMFLTRLGSHSKMLVTGDITQIDLDRKQESGFIHSLKILKNIPDIRFIHFTDQDVVRHPLVKKILKAYESHEGKDGKNPPKA